MTSAQDVLIGNGASPAVLYLRVTRVGDLWTFRRSLDGTSWTQIGTGFTSALVVRRVGVHAGNGAGNPAHTARFDFFFDTAAPIVPEDQGGLCGDGVVNPGEQCDLGAGNSNAPGATCRPDCTNARCGDGIVDPGEGCDDGNLAAGTAATQPATTRWPAATARSTPARSATTGTRVSGDGCSSECKKLVSDDFRTGSDQSEPVDDGESARGRDVRDDRAEDGERTARDRHPVRDGARPLPDVRCAAR